MKSKNKKFINILVVVIISLFLLSYNCYKNQDSNIQGTWISETDASWKMVFNDTDCTWYYENQLTDVYNYLISNSSPQCEIVVQVTAESKYLHISNSTDSNDQICYEIYGLSNTTLTLREINKSGFLIFQRQ